MNNKSPLLSVGQVFASSFNNVDGNYLKVSCQVDCPIISGVLYAINPGYENDQVISLERLNKISMGETRQADCWVEFGEGKMMADEIIYLRALITKLSNPKPNSNEDTL